MRRKKIGSRIIAAVTAAVIACSVNVMTDAGFMTKTVEAADNALPERLGEDGNKEIPGTTSSFSRYDSSFLSVSGYAKGKVNDRSQYVGTEYHRQVKTPAELVKALYDAQTIYNDDGSVKKASTVKVIEIMCDLNAGYDEARVASEFKDTSKETCLFLKDDLSNTKNILVNTLISAAGGVSKIQIKRTDGLTIFSRYGVTLNRTQFDIQSTSNDIIIRNIKMDGSWQWDNSAHHKESGWTYVKVNGTNIWLDHCEFTIAGDGCVDLESGANGITYSWCKFGLSPDEALTNPSIVASINEMERRYQMDLEAIAAGTQKEGEFLNCDINAADGAPGIRYKTLRQAGATPEEIMQYTAFHSKVSLCGAGDKDITTNPNIRISLGYNLYESVAQRIPMIRQGTGHLYNCVVDNTKHTALEKKFKNDYKVSGGYTLTRCINARNGASIAADTCVFNSVNGAITGQQRQGGDTGNMSDEWGIHFQNAINHSLIVNSKGTTTDGKPYSGSSWDNDGETLFTENAKSFWQDKSIMKQWAWSSEVTDTNVVPNVPFTFKYNYDEKLPYEYKLLPLDDVEEKVKAYSGMGVYDLTPEQWCMVEYSADSDIKPAGDDKVYIASSVNFVDSELVTYVGDKIKFDIVTNPVKVTDPKIEWSVKNGVTGKATIDSETGELTAETKGKVTITVKVTSINGISVSKSATVNIKDASLKPPTPVEPTGTPVEPSGKPVEPTDKPVEPSDKPVEPSDTPVEPSDTPVEPTDKPVEPSDKPVEPSGTPVEPTTGLAGDVDCNNKVDLEDAKIVLRLAVGVELKNPVSEQGKKNADFDNSSKIDLKDATYTLKTAVGINFKLPNK